MTFDEIVLHNYKCFLGTCCLAGLSTRLQSTRSIVLIGGMNGAGKTSLLESVLLCLYGRKVSKLGLYPSRGAHREPYEAFLGQTLNRVAARSPYSIDMYVELRLFDFDLLGTQINRETVLRRTWHFAPTGEFEGEKLTARDRDGKELNEFPDGDELQKAIEDLLPVEAAQYFFFDGEKIQDFIRDPTAEFAQSLRAVMGLTKYQQLAKDLQDIRRDFLAENTRGHEQRNRYDEIQKEISALELGIAKREEQLADLKGDIEDIEAKCAELEDEMGRSVRGNPLRYDDLVEEEKQLGAKREALERELQPFFELVPLVWLGKIATDVRKQIVRERQVRDWQSRRDALEPRIDSLIDDVFTPSPPQGIEPVVGRQRSYYSHRLRQALESFIGNSRQPSGMVETTLIHDLATDVADSLVEAIDNNPARAVPYTRWIEEYQSIDAKLDRVRRERQRYQSGDQTFTDLMLRHNELQQELGAARAKRTEREQDIAIARQTRSQREGDRSKLEKEIAQNQHVQAQIKYCEDMIAAIEDFQTVFQRVRVERLQDYTELMWSDLSHKDWDLRTIRIDAERNFEVQCIDKHGQQLDRTKLSAGEKEVLAFSLIWALTNCTDQRVPVIIDTPLARLDSDHRARIVRKYFPEASHQVLILSHDAEVVGEHYQELRSSIAHEYLIEYVQADEKSIVRDGYFPNA